MDKKQMKVTKDQAEMALAQYKDAERRKAVADAEMKAHKEKIKSYALEHLDDFVDKNLLLENGKVSLEAGPAKSVTLEGKALSTAARAKLAAALPVAYVKITLDTAALFACDDKKVRQILNAQGVRIVKEDQFTIL